MKRTEMIRLAAERCNFESKDWSRILSEPDPRRRNVRLRAMIGVVEREVRLQGPLIPKVLSWKVNGSFSKMVAGSAEAEVKAEAGKIRLQGERQILTVKELAALVLIAHIHERGLPGSGCT
jgi:hypothetical protein